MQAAKEHGFFDAVIVNDDLQRAVLEFEGVLKSWYPNMF
jgi:guanylate kinase